MEGGFLLKGIYRKRGSLRNRKEGRGLRAKLPSFFLLSSRETEEGGERLGSAEKWRLGTKELLVTRGLSIPSSMLLAWMILLPLDQLAK